MRLPPDSAGRDQLAAEYVLGTLRGRARRRFEAWLVEDAQLRAAVARWQGHLAPLAERVPEVAPPARVWQGIARRVPALTAAPPARTGWAATLNFWRSATFVMAVLAALAVALPYYRGRSLSGDSVAAAGAPAYIATIEDPTSHAPVAVMLMADAGSEVTLQLVNAAVSVPQDRVLQLWMANPAGSGVVSAGLAPAGRGATPVRFAVPDPEHFRHAPLLGLSLEPPGGSPQATHLLGLGKWSPVGGT